MENALLSTGKNKSLNENEVLTHDKYAILRRIAKPILLQFLVDLLKKLSILKVCLVLILSFKNRCERKK
jgi:hypothetical protein